MNSLYINLNHRTDRKEQIEKELQDFNYQRVEAIYTPKKGWVGCAHSHLKAINLAKTMDIPYIAIFEDDFMFIRDKMEVINVIKNTKLNWDVILLSRNGGLLESTTGDLIRIKNAKTTSGFIVNQKYFNKFEQMVHECIHLLSKNSNNKKEYSIDAYWLNYQNKDNWYTINPIAGRQRPGYSDIEKKYYNYGA